MTGRRKPEIHARTDVALWALNRKPSSELQDLKNSHAWLGQPAQRSPRLH